MDTLIESLKTLIKQSTEALGPEAPATLMLKQQLAAAQAKEEEPRKKVFWMESAQSRPRTDEKPG